jgi:hypothetical protein
MSLWADLKKKGFVITKSFSLDKKTVSVDQSIQKAMDREKITSTFFGIKYFLLGLLEYKSVPDPVDIHTLLNKVNSCLSDLAETENK